MGVLAALVALLCVWAPQASGAEGCGGFKRLENGQTFFRYAGLLVIFRCRPGYKLHGYKTNSCVSEHWSRDTPVCVGSGCPDPGPLSHGTSSTNEDGSWVVFSCNGGFQLHGPSMLYCKGPTWNGTKPVCKESDMMRSVSRVNVQPPNARQNLQAGVVPKTQQQSRYDAPTDTAFEEEKLRSVLFSHTPSQMPGRERIKVTNPDLHLQPNVQFSDFKVKDGVRTNPVEAKLQEANEAQQGEEPGGGRHRSQAELAPCSVNHGGCSQLCSLSEHYNQSTSRTRTRSRCHCRAGFTLLHDGRTCRDIDECAVNQGLGPCAERCLNSPGSYRCSCSYGYILAGNGRSCIAECPPGYRKQPAAAPPENSTAPALREECVDINECQEGTCEGQCVNLPGSHRCICPRGYALHGDGRRCKDINECSRKNGGCSHLCLNQKGGYKCACPGSHRLSPYSWKKCLPRTTAASAG